MSSSSDTIATAAPAAAMPHAGARLGRRRFLDRLARVVVVAGGIAIIASIAGIQLFILAEVWPLMKGATLTPESKITAFADVAAVVVDEHRTHAAGLGVDGVARLWRVKGNAPIAERDLREALGGSAPSVVVRTQDGKGLAAAAGTKVALLPVSFSTEWSAEKRTVTGSFAEPVAIDVGKPVRALSARITEEGFLVTAALQDGGIAIFTRKITENAITGESSSSDQRIELETQVPVDHVLLDEAGRHLHAAAGSQVWWWSGLDSRPAVVDAGAKVTALGHLLGERTLLVGDEEGTVSVWFPVRKQGNEFVLTRIREFAGKGSVRALAASPRDKGFFALEEGGYARLHHSTSERTLWTGTPLAGAAALVYAPKADGVIFAGAGGVLPIRVENPHPDVSFKALFGKVWYEGYDAPAHVWQSTGGTDDFETKLSLTPLLFGTVKGTLYSLLLAIPLAVFGAMYTSQFMHPRLRSWVKPAVELMAALPSVVLGFMAGLWLAPRLETGLPALLLAIAVVPVAVIAGGIAWTSIPRAKRQGMPAGAEVVVFAAAIVAGIWVSIMVAPVFEGALFGGSLRSFVVGTLGLGYDQRNALVVGLAMGFAVIPIIFAISEDAFTNVPSSLTSASLALGANRWQTVSRVVLPAASPGIFSAVMVGFGRAVGETMIVLMATGNTPIMEWNPFNGFRTLSANIAVEIPEAPHGATLYRTLFLAALLLFVMTFSVNTIAELVRQRLRRKYSEAA